MTLEGPALELGSEVELTKACVYCACMVCVCTCMPVCLCVCMYVHLFTCATSFWVLINQIGMGWCTVWSLLVRR